MLSILVISEIIALYSCFLIQGLVIEAIHHIKNPTTGEAFVFPLFVINWFSTTALLLGIILKYLNSEENIVFSNFKNCIQSFKLKNKSTKEMEKTRSFCVDIIKLSTIYSSSMFFSHLSGYKVSYPIQIVVKSTKPVPVLLSGYFILGKKYKTSEYVSTLIIISALILFQIPKLLHSNNNLKSSTLGYLALFSSLCCDSLMVAKQEILKNRYKLNSLDLVIALNMIASFGSFIFGFFIDGLEPYRAIVDIGIKIIFKVMAYSVLTSVGQVFAVRLLMRVGPLNLSLITSIRKFFSIILSVIIYQHALHFYQWISVFILIFSGSIMSIYKRRRYKN